MEIDGDVLDEILVITQTEMPLDDTCLSLDLIQQHQPLGGSRGFSGNSFVLGIRIEI